MKETIIAIGEIYQRSTLKARSGHYALCESRLLQASQGGTVLGMIEQLCESMQSSPPALSGVISEVKEHNVAILAWIRCHYKIASVLAQQSRFEPDAFKKTIEEIDWMSDGSKGDTMLAIPKAQIPIHVTLTAPLAHGADTKAGNATLFRRCTALAKNGGLLHIPFYAGNALRGQIRDLLADHLTHALGLSVSRRDPPYKAWFFHSIYAGGALSEASDTTVPKKTRKKIGERANATVKLDQQKRLRDMLPSLSLLGVAIGKSILAGKLDVLDLLPRCQEVGTGPQWADGLLSWQYLTRRDDLELPHEDHHGMIATWEVMIPGAVLDGGVDPRSHIREVELACLHRGLLLLVERGVLGGNARRGWGRCQIEIDGPLDPAPYDTYLKEHREEILSYLRELDALC